MYGGGPSGAMLALAGQEIYHFHLLVMRTPSTAARLEVPAFGGRLLVRFCESRAWGNKE